MKLTDHQANLLLECTLYALHEDKGKLWRLGGHGKSHIRYNFWSVRKLQSLGLITQGSVWKATDLGREVYKTHYA